ncbi:hypothetical protein MBLNU230_g0262t1 [Neophaeotheca triangularis]
MPKQTLLLIYIHGFKGSDDTFSALPSDLRSLLTHSLPPSIQVQNLQYPQYETRGDLRDCVERFREWLVNKVVDLEVENGTASPSVEPGVRVVLVGHSMGGIVAAESLLGVVGEEVIGREGREPVNEAGVSSLPSEKQTRSGGLSALFFPRIQAVLAFDTPFLGISPGVLAHGAEEHLNTASSAYKAYTNATNIFGGKGGASSASARQGPGASAKGLPAADGSTGGRGGWGKFAMYGGAAAALAAAGGAAYMNWNQIGNGMKWAGSHLEFVGCLARGAELQKRVEKVVALRKSHGVGFANFYGALDKKTTDASKYAGAVAGAERTFVVVPRASSSSSSSSSSPTGSKRSSSASAKGDQPRKRRKSSSVPDAEGMEAEMSQGEQVAEFADDASKSKGHWVKCVNEAAADELKAHTSMFDPKRNPGYHGMVTSARDWLVEIVGESGWVDRTGGSGGSGEREKGDGLAAADNSAEEEAGQETSEPKGDGAV